VPVKLLGLFGYLGQEPLRDPGRIVLGGQLQHAPACLGRRGDPVDTARRRVDVPVGDQRDPE
jgi:hypothetical protein